jgi:E3 ubiquitin-protein ligase RFWD3
MSLPVAPEPEVPPLIEPDPEVPPPVVPDPEVPVPIDPDPEVPPALAPVPVAPEDVRDPPPVPLPVWAIPTEAISAADAAPAIRMFRFISRSPAIQRGFNLCRRRSVPALSHR